MLPLASRSAWAVQKHGCNIIGSNRPPRLSTRATSASATSGSSTSLRTWTRRVGVGGLATIRRRDRFLLRHFDEELPKLEAEPTLAQTTLTGWKCVLSDGRRRCAASTESGNEPAPGCPRNVTTPPQSEPPRDTRGAGFVIDREGTSMRRGVLQGENDVR